MAHTSEQHTNQIHPDAIEKLAVDAIHASVDGNLGGMVEETNELLEKADAPVQVVEAPPKDLEELVKRAKARSPEERERRREDIIHAMAGRIRSRPSDSVFAVGRTLTARKS